MLLTPGGRIALTMWKQARFFFHSWAAGHSNHIEVVVGEHHRRAGHNLGAF
jgi:hypothetical protein